MHASLVAHTRSKRLNASHAQPRTRNYAKIMRYVRVSYCITYHQSQLRQLQVKPIELHFTHGILNLIIKR